MRHHHAELYECDICGNRFQEAERALACESGGRPAPRFEHGARVLLTGGDYREQFPDRTFRVTATRTVLDRPGLKVWEEGPPGRHLVVYVIEADCVGCRITFVPEHHLTAAGGKSDA